MAAKTQNELQAEFRWDDARILLALHRERTFQGAAKRLGVNASTISRRLDALEESLGARLFDRTPDGASATAEAEQLVPLAEQMEHAAMGLAQAVSGFEREPEGYVTISAPPGIAENVLAPALPRLYARYPRIRLRIDARIAYVDLTRHEADLALRGMRPTGGDLVAVKLGTATEEICASPKYATELGTLKSFGDARWIQWGEDLAGMSAYQWVASNVPDSSIVMRTSSMAAQLMAMEHGLGVMWVAAPLQKARKVVPVKLSKALAAIAPPSTGTLWLVGHRALRNVPRVAAVWEWMIEESARIGIVND
jgi:DNA-binding transcriptional LysR family regulator